MDFFLQLNNRISQILVIVLKNRSNEIRSNEICSNEIRIRQKLPVNEILINFYIP